MADSEQSALLKLEAQIPELRSAYKAAMNRFRALQQDTAESRRQALREMHSAGLAFFNAIDRSIVLGSLDGSASNSTWFTDKAETCANVLDTILLHYCTVRQRGPEVGIPRDSLSPSTTAYANIQRMVAQHDPQLAARLRASFETEGLPVYGFDKEETKREETNVSSDIQQVVVQQFYSERLRMGDQYTVGQAAAVGPHSKAENISFQQVWNQRGQDIDLTVLAAELSTLRNSMRKEATELDHDKALAAVALAEESARQKDGPGALQNLKVAGKWTLDIATKIGTAVAVKAIESAIGL